MTQKIINIGTAADKGNGDPIRTAFTKVNENFTELFNHVSAGVTLGNIPPTTPGVGDLWWDTTSGRLYVYYNSAWIDASPVDGEGISSTNELVNGNKNVSLASTGIITLPSSSYLESTDTNLKVGAQGTITIRSNAASNLTTKAWVFGTNGRTMFPAATVPEHSYGTTGDKAGMVAFDATYIYYCTADYVNNTTDIWKRVALDATPW
jgi:hypothetical protein